MKIGVWVREGIDYQRGGAFSYQSKLLELIDEHEFAHELELSFITSDKYFSAKKEVIQINDVFSGKDTNGEKGNDVLIKIPLLSRLIKKKRKSLLRSRMEDVRRTLKTNKVDVIYHLTQASHLLPDYPFISTNWDVGHLSTYTFPEFHDAKSRANRIFWYSRGIQNALAVFVESESGKKELVNYTNINPSRVMVIPMFPGDIIDLSVSKINQDRILEKHKLEREKFFFYPAQFWAHKNHYNLVKAFKKISKAHPEIKLVLTGSDKGGNLDYILDIIRDENIKGISYLGFVEKEEVFTFYKNAIALVMPTFLGPTNMPPLEALALGCPVICTNLQGHKEQLSNAAIYIDPLDQDEIFDAMMALLKEDVRNELMLKAKDRLKEINFNPLATVNALEKNLLTIRNYRNTWNT